MTIDLDIVEVSVAAVINTPIIAVEVAAPVVAVTMASPVIEVEVASPVIAIDIAAGPFRPQPIEDTELTYDVDGFLIAVTSQSSDKTLAYDGTDRLQSVTDSIGGWTKTLVYNGSGQLTNITVS